MKPSSKKRRPPTSAARGSKPPRKKKGGRSKKTSGPKPKNLSGPPRTVSENPRAKALAQDIARLLLEKKAIDVVVLDVRGMTSYADYLVLGSGESERQVSAMAEHVELELKQKKDTRPIGSEGYETGHWVLVDYGEVVAHLFYTEVRSFYDLDGLWADAPRQQVGDAA